MPIKYRTPFARSMMLATISSLSIFAHGQSDLLKELQISGFVDIYYQFSGNQPRPNVFLPYRNFDIRHNSFSLAAAQLNIVKPTSEKNPFGFTLNLLAGRNADLQALGEPTGPDNATKHLQQAYVTYAGPEGLTVDLGKFVTWVGAESLFAMNNDLYSLSFVFTLGQPSYHLGLRATKPLGATSLSLYAVNGWNEAEDSNGGKTIGATVSQTFGKVFAAFNYYGGNEGSDITNGAYIAPVGQTNIQLADLVLSAQLTPKLKLSSNIDYASADAQEAGAPNGTWFCYNVTGKYKLSNSVSVAARYDNFFDYAGARSGLDARFNSVAGNIELTTGDSSVLRFEVRHDESNRRAFEAEGGGLGRRARTTYTLAHIFKF